MKHTFKAVLLASCIGLVPVACSAQSQPQQMAAVATSQPGQMDAAELITRSQRAVGAVVRAARAAPQLDSSKSEAKPFWKAMKELNEALDKAQTGMTLKDDTFFTGLASAHGQVIQADVAITMSGANNAALTKAMQTLTGLVTTLDQNYSKEAARLRKGGELTKEERRQLDELKKQQKEIMAKLDQVERNAAKNNKKMQEGIKKIRREAEKIRRAGYTSSGFVDGFIASRIMSSWMWGWHWWWGPWGAWCPGWIDINIIIWDGWIDAVPYDWGYVDVAIDIDYVALELDMGTLDISDADLIAADDYLIDQEFDINDGDLVAMTDELDLGWDDVQTQDGLDIQDMVEHNFEEVPFDMGSEAEIESFEDYAMDDFGEDFGTMDLGFDFDAESFDGFDDFGDYGY
ncbi:hypothetical protein [Altererythrobacter sp.]|uniref:hypothetical protein n=1 Tax=Altererythrobacter sp. TaxID=1872480 RepID=UPI003D11A4E2